MRYMHFVGTLVAPGEYTSQDYQSWRRSGEAFRQVTFERMYPDQVLCGDPSQAVERVALMQEEFGVSHFWVYMDVGRTRSTRAAPFDGALCHQGDAAVSRQMIKVVEARPRDRMIVRFGFRVVTLSPTEPSEGSVFLIARDNAAQLSFGTR